MALEEIEAVADAENALLTQEEPEQRRRLSWHASLGLLVVVLIAGAAVLSASSSQPSAFFRSSALIVFDAASDASAAWTAATARAAAARAAAAAAAAAAARARHEAFLRSKWHMEGVVKWQGERDCSSQLADMDILTNKSLKRQPYVGTAADCQKACTETPDCDAFAWGYKRNVWGLTDNCFLKTLNETLNEKLEYKKKEGIISGLPCNRTAGGKYWWPNDLPTRFDLPKPGEDNHHDLDVSSMLCIALMQPYSYEQGLLTLQHDQKLGIFQCDKHAVYSSQKIQLTEDLVTRKIVSTQKCEIGGQFGSALNTEIFMAFWRAVIQDDEYRQYSWVVKVDPDTVFFPARLRPLLHKYEYGLNKTGIYLNNCRLGLHGPIEVLSQNAVRSLATHAIKCYWAFTGMCHGPGDCNWGEDIWIDQCFQRFAGVQRGWSWQLMVEEHCDRWPNWRSCQDWNRVSFHPFKDVSQYKACVERAEAVRNSSTEKVNVSLAA